MHPCFQCLYFQQDALLRQAKYSILINTNTRRLTLLRDNQFFKSYPVAVGKPATPTPKGSFKIINTAINPGGPFGVRWLGLNAPGGDYGIHGTNNPASIGKAVSNGCVRLQNRDILDLVKYAGIGTSVKIV